MKVTCFTYCIPVASWKLPASLTVFLLLYESYLLHLLYSCCFMKVTCFTYCIPVALWKLPASLTVFLLPYENYLLHLLYSCCFMKVACFSHCIPAGLWKLPTSVSVFLPWWHISLGKYEAWHLHNWLLGACLTPLSGLISGLVQIQCGGQKTCYGFHYTRLWMPKRRSFLLNFSLPSGDMKRSIYLRFTVCHTIFYPIDNYLLISQ